MAQTHPRLSTWERPFLWAARWNLWIDGPQYVAFAAVAAGIAVMASRWTGGLTPPSQVDLSPRALPLYAGLSTMRMAIAYGLSLIFSLVYARIAVAHRTAERAMIPALDILQSIPILSFLPGVVLALVALFPGRTIGLELAAVILIFTSQAWNMAFSFHQSLITIPNDLREASRIYRLGFWQRFSRLELPFGTIPLIWNSMMSWAGGWFFLMAAEQFTLGSHSFQLPGLGSYLQMAANAGDVGALLLGLLTLISVIVLLDQFVWRPLIAWADHFKVEQTAGLAPPGSFILSALQRSVLAAWLRQQILGPVAGWLDRRLSRLTATRDPARTAVGAASIGSGWRRALGIVIALAAVVAVGLGVTAAIQLLIQLPAQRWGTVGLSAGATLLRTSAALAIATAWTVPVGVFVGTRPRWARRVQPLIQILASIPATALFPALLLLLLGIPGGLNLAAVALMLLGTQWYVLFNVLAGAMALPTDLREAAQVYKLRGWRRWRTLILPGIFPFLVTGLITATGGAWNASIVSEFVTFGQHTYQTVGLGALIAGSAGSDYPTLLAATLTMAAVVVTINRVFWRRLYRLAERRYHLD